MEIRKLVDSMTPIEILELYGRQDALFANHKIHELTKKHQKLLYPKTSEPKFFKAVEYKRVSGLNLVLQCFDKGNSYPTKQRLGIHSYFWFVYRSGISAIRIVPDPIYGILKYWYTSHFIERYRERHLKDLDINKPKALELFLCNNMKRISKNIPSVHYGMQNFWQLCNDGICLTEIKPDSFIVSKTFIPWDTLSLNKREIIKDISQYINNKKFESIIPLELLADIVD